MTKYHDNINLAIRQNRLKEETVRLVMKTIIDAGKKGISPQALREAIGCSRSGIDGAILALRKDGAPIYTIGWGKNLVYVWEELKIIELMDY